MPGPILPMFLFILFLPVSPYCDTTAPLSWSQLFAVVTRLFATRVACVQNSGVFV
jgi:hypothetical protein